MTKTGRRPTHLTQRRDRLQGLTLQQEPGKVAEGGRRRDPQPLGANGGHAKPGASRGLERGAERGRDVETRERQSPAEHHQALSHGVAKPRKLCPKRRHRSLHLHPPARRSPRGQKHGRSPGASSPAGHSPCRRRSSGTGQHRAVPKQAKRRPHSSRGGCT